jgi:predicted dehydrogenase
MSASVRVGVLGLGAVAQAVHLPLMAKRPDLVQIAAVADIAAEVTQTIGARYGIPEARRFTSYEDMIAAGGLDAIMVLARGSHAEAVLQAWDAGLAVFCEKPLAYTTADVDELIARRPSGGPSILVGYMKQYDPAVLAAARLVAEIDDVRSIEATVMHPPGASQLEIARLVTSAAPLPADVQAASDAEDDRLRRLAVGDADTATWRAYRGSLVSSLAHDLSIMRSFGAPPLDFEHADIWRQTSTKQVRDPGRDRRSFGEHPPSIAAEGTLAGGGRFRLAWHYLPDFPAYRETVRVIHGAGSIELVFPSPYLMHAPTELIVTTADGDAERRSVSRDVTEAFETQLVAFADMVRDGRAPLTGLEGGRADILDCQRLLATYAARVGERIGGEVGEQIRALTGSIA